MSFNPNVVEIDAEFYKKYYDLILEYSEASADLVVTSEGLSVLEKKLMKLFDEEFYETQKKRLPEYIQKREARADIRYINAIRAKAEATRKSAMLKGVLHLMDMQFNGWQTRSANKRGGM